MQGAQGGFAAVGVRGAVRQLRYIIPNSIQLIPHFHILHPFSFFHE
jgi:hypothetical protein